MLGEVLPENHSGTNRMTSVVRNRSWDLRGAFWGVDPWGLGGVFGRSRRVPGRVPAVVFGSLGNVFEGHDFGPLPSF